MKKKWASFLSLIMVSAMILTGCGGGNSGSTSNIDTDGLINMYDGENAITDFVTYQTLANEIDDFCIQHSQLAKNSQVLTNLVSGLVSMDENGNLIANVATSWEANEDSSEWTFYLRDDVVWVDVNGEEQAGLTSADFVAGLEWVLNAWKNEAVNTSMMTEMVKGAQEYYDLTAAMTEEEACALTWDNELFLETVGISTPDSYTLVYTCLASKPYFPTVATYCCLFPAPVDLISGMEPAEYRAIDNTTMWYNGPYIMTEYIQNSEKILTANPTWFGNEDHTRFNTVTIKMVEDVSVAFTMYKAGEIDHVTLNESTLALITEGTDSEYYDYLVASRPTKYAYEIYFNWDKLYEDGTEDVNWNTAVANEAFRKSIYYGVNLLSYLAHTNPITPLDNENNFLTMQGLVSTTDGTDYVDLVAQYLNLSEESDGTTTLRYNAELGEQYKEQAIEELTALGVTFPVEIRYYISASSSSALDAANILKNVIENCLGSDYVTLTIDTYTSSLVKEVASLQLGSIYTSGWGADYGDPINFLSQQVVGDANAYYSVTYQKINNYFGDDAKEAYDETLIEYYEEYTAMVKAADAIVDDLDARYEALAECEAYLIDHCFTIPLYYNITWNLTKVNPYTQANSVYGSIANYYYVDWETNSDGYTTAEIDAYITENGF